MTITEFLEARIAEDGAHHYPYHSADFGYAPGDPTYGCVECGIMEDRACRVQRECAAKRKILQRAVSLGDDGHYAADYMPSREHEALPGEVGGRRIYPGHPLFTQTVILSGVLRDIATIYADHPEYNPDWAI
jgi:hypothetical protein